jgi:hypothetical protein
MLANDRDRAPSNRRECIMRVLPTRVFRHGRIRRSIVSIGAVAATTLALAVIQPVAAEATTTIASSPTASTSVNGQVDEFAYLGNVLYAVGEFTQATDNGTTVARNHALAVDWTTGHLLPWNPAPNGAVYSIAVDSASGWVYLGGGFGKVQNVTTKDLARVSTTGTGVADPTWVHNADGTVWGLSVGNGRLYAGGAFLNVDSQPRAGLAAFSLSTGALDTSWLPQAVGGKVHTVTATPTRVYIASEADTLDGSASASKLGAVDPATGALDTSFKVRVPYRVFKIAVTATAIYAAADGNGGHLWSIGLDGSTNWIVTADGGFQAVTVVGGLIIGGGHFQNVCATPAQGAQGTCIDGQVTRNKFLAVDTSGNLQSWDPNADSALGDFALATSPDGSQVAAGGDFTNFHSGTVVQPHLALFSAGTDGGGGGGAPSNIGFRAVTGINQTQLNPSVVVPASVQAGDVMLLVDSSGGAATETAPAGWTVLGTQLSQTLLTTVWQKVATSTDAGSSVTVGLDVSSKTDLHLLAYSGAQPASAILLAQDGSSNAHTAPSATVATAGSWVVRYWADKTSSTTTWTAPGGVVSRGSLVGTGTGRVSTLLADSGAGVVAGLSGSATATTDATSGRGVSVTVVLPSS